MKTYKISAATATVSSPTGGEFSGTKFVVGFGEPAPNNDIVREVHEYLTANPPTGGKFALVDGPASLPVAFVLAHSLIHRFGAVAVRDPKLSSFVVVATHDPDFAIGQIIPS